MNALREWRGGNLCTPRHVRQSFLLTCTTVGIAHCPVGAAVHVVVAAHGVLQRAAAVRSARCHAASVTVGAVRPPVATGHDGPRDGAWRTRPLLSVLPCRSQRERSAFLYVDIVMDAPSSGKVARCSFGTAVFSISAAHGIPRRTATALGDVPQCRSATSVAGGTCGVVLRIARDVAVRNAVYVAKRSREEHGVGHSSCVGRLARVRFVVAHVTPWTAVLPVRTADGVGKRTTCEFLAGRPTARTIGDAVRSIRAGLVSGGGEHSKKPDDDVDRGRIS